MRSIARVAKRNDVVNAWRQRFANEAEWIRERLGGEVWEVRRPGLPVAAGHSSEAGLPDELIDRRIDNDGSIDELRVAVATARFAAPASR